MIIEQGELLGPEVPGEQIDTLPAARRATRTRTEKTEVQINNLRSKQLRKHVAAIHTSGELSLLERKMANVLLLNAYDNLLTERNHKINIKILCAMLGWSTTNNLEDLRGALRGLVSKSIEFDLMDEGKEDWQITSLLSFGRIKDGVCSYRYDEALAERLYDPEMYATINLQMQKQFEGGYALTLYENIVRYKGVGQTGWWDLDKFRSIIGATQPYYNEFRRLKEKVIIPSIKEINRVSDIEASFDLTKQGVRVVAIKFFIKDGAQQTLLNPLNRSEFNEIKEKPVFKKLVEHGISELLALTWVAEDENRAAEAIAKAESLDKAGKIKSNTAGYIRTLIESGAVIGKTPFQEKKEKEKAENKRQQKIKADEDRLADLRAQFSREAWKKFRDSLTKEKVEAYLEMFSSTEEGAACHSFDFEKMSFPDPTHNLKFNTWIRTSIKKPFGEEEFKSWLEQKGY